MKRKALALGLSAVMVASLAGCGSGTSSKNNAPASDLSVSNEEFFSLGRAD